jgi:LacI family transcriptional regulator
MTTRQKAAPPTQRDVAELAGVSRSTVAAVVGRNPSTSVIGECTRDRVRAAARKLGYRAHSAAVTLRSGRTHNLVLAVPRMKAVGGDICLQILEGLGDRAKARGYTLSICCYDHADDVSASLYTALKESRFDGVAFYASGNSDEDPRAQTLNEMGIPFVVLQSYSERNPSVAFDDAAGMRAGVNHLLAQGRRDVAFLGLESPWSQSRRQTVVAALADAGLEIGGTCTFTSQSDADDNIGGLHQQMANAGAFDAIVCASDRLACLALQALWRLGRRCPEDVAVIGCDDAPIAQLSVPPLTTVRLDGVAMGWRAVDILLAAIDGRPEKPLSVVLSTELVVRESCGGGGRNG